MLPAALDSTAACHWAVAVAGATQAPATTPLTIVFCDDYLDPRLGAIDAGQRAAGRSEEHTSELQSPCNLVCRLLLEKKKKTRIIKRASNTATPCGGRCVLRGRMYVYGWLALLQ